MLLLLGAAIWPIAQLVAAQPTTNQASGIALNTTANSPDSFKSWASFCNDEGCGEWVDITNTGCLAENYRRSIKFKSDYGPDVRGGLVYSPGNSCSCQSECDAFYFPNREGCLVLNTTINYETFSYRLIGHDVLWPCSLTGNNC